jgi:hypothetical protein
VTLRPVLNFPQLWLSCERRNRTVASVSAQQIYFLELLAVAEMRDSRGQ